MAAMSRMAAAGVSKPMIMPRGMMLRLARWALRAEKKRIEGLIFATGYRRVLSLQLDKVLTALEVLK